VDPDSRRLRIAVTDGQGRPVRAPGLQHWLEALAPVRARGTLAVALATDAEVQALNHQFRGKDEPTDVLTFPAETDAGKTGASARTGRGGRGASNATAPASVVPSLGDIVIATGVARRQAAEAGHSYATELRVLALHGLLHLLGYDHHARDDRGRMASAEARLRRKGGLTAGLIERASPPAPARRKRTSQSGGRKRTSQSGGRKRTSQSGGRKRTSQR
jgi:probable rRNA maturation factor